MNNMKTLIRINYCHYHYYSLSYLRVAYGCNTFMWICLKKFRYEIWHDLHLYKTRRYRILYKNEEYKLYLVSNIEQMV